MESHTRSIKATTFTRAEYIRFLFIGSVIYLAAFLVHGDVNLNPSDYYSKQTELFIWLNQTLAHWPRFWSNVTELGSVYLLFPLVSFLIIRQPQAWAALFGAVPLSTAICLTGKHLTAIPRPAAVIPSDQFSILGPALMSHNSLPSGHTITAFAVVSVVVLSHLSVTGGKGKWPCIFGGLFIAGLIGISRIAVGAHWPLDVVTGGIFGTIGGISGVALVRRYHQWWSWIETRHGHWIFSIIMLIWGTALAKDALLVANNITPIFWVSATFAVTVSAILMSNPPSIFSKK